MLTQNLLNGFMSGWIYILVALGLTLVLSIVGIVQLAHGEIYMVGAYIVYYFCVSIGLNFFWSLILSMIFTGLLGVILEKFFLRPFRHDVEGAIISTIALILILQTAVVSVAGVSYRDIPSPIQGVFTILGARLSWERLITVLVSIALVSGLLFLITRTKIGQAMVAVSEDREAAALQGINVDCVSSVAMFLGCSLAAAAGGLTGAIFDVTPYVGGFALMKGIEVIILGGLGSIPGAIIGGLILGLIDGLVTPLLSAQMAGIMSLVVIILILLFRPQGLLGHG